MNIHVLDYTFKMKSLDIYLSGCKGPHCPGCQNPELWSFQKGTPWNKWKDEINWYVDTYNRYIDNIMVFGGEPFDQDMRELIDFLVFIKSKKKNVWVFTRREEHEIPLRAKQFIDYIKCGWYDYRLETKDNVQCGIELATSNQYIVKVD